MITANLAGAASSHLRSERSNYSHSRLNLNEDNSDSASKKDEIQNQNSRIWIQDAEKCKERVIERCSNYKTVLYLSFVALIIVGAIGSNLPLILLNRYLPNLLVLQYKIFITFRL